MKKTFKIALIIMCSVASVWWFFYLLWNHLIAGVFGLFELTFWQSTGLLLLLSVVWHLLAASLYVVVRAAK